MQSSPGALSKLPPVSASPGTRSLLELLLPGGAARRALVVGGDCPPGLAPGPGAEDDEPVDLIVLAPTSAEAATPGWLDRAAEACRLRLAEDGLAYVLAPPLRRARLHASLRGRGLRIESAVLHLPDLRRTRQLIPLERAVAAHAVSRLVPLASRRHRAAGAALRLPGARAVLRAVGPVALVARRPGGRPLFEWLYRLDGATLGRHAGVVVSTGWEERARRAVLHRFGGPGDGLAVAKAVLVPDAASSPEAGVLARLGPEARAAGAAVPYPLTAARVQGAPVLLQTGLPGEIVASLLGREPVRLVEALSLVCRWLGEWQQRTASRTRPTRAQLEREVLDPAAAVAPSIDGGERYLAGLTARCRAAEGASIPLTASHNDLTMWNVLMDRRGGIGIVDWETGQESALPLKDFFYAAVDAVAATERYADRVAAARACLDPGGRHAGTIGALQGSLVNALALPPAAVELSLHSCWLGHAANEGRKAAPGAARPFRDIVQWLARREADVAAA